MSERVMAGNRLAKLLRVHDHTIQRWRESGYLRPDRGRNPYLYLYTTVDRFLAAHFSTDKPPPTVASLLAYEVVTGSPGLLLVRETCERLGVTEKTVRGHIQRGNLPAVSFRGRGTRHTCVRILASGLRAFMTRHQGTVTVGYAARLLGLNIVMTRRLVAQGKLTSKTGERSRRRDITVGSLMMFMATLLDDSTPEEWWAMRVAYKFEPLLTKKQAYTLTGSTRRLQRDIAARTLPYIRTPGGQVRIPLHAVLAWKNKHRATLRANQGQRG